MMCFNFFISLFFFFFFIPSLQSTYDKGEKKGYVKVMYDCLGVHRFFFFFSFFLPETLNYTRHAT